MRNISTIILLAILLTSTSCSSFLKKEVLVDNPSNEDIVVVIDNVTYNIPALSSEKIKVATGEHQVSATIGENEIFNELVSVTDKGIINVTGETYVIWKDLYLEDLDKYEDYAEDVLKNGDHEINEKNYEDVDFEVFEGTSFIKENWDYGIFEDWADEVDITSGTYIIKSKIYRLPDLEEDWGFFGEFDFSNLSDEELDAFLDSLILETDIEQELLEE